MKIVIVRHGIAMEREDWAAQSEDDDLRPLTSEGEKRMRRAARGIEAVLKGADVVATSPLTRARQTAQIVADGLGVASLTEVTALAPGAGAEAVVAWLQSQDAEATVVLVGHEPDLSELVAWLTTASHQAFMPLKKGSACLLEAEGRPDAGSFLLRWALTPAQLRDLAG
jgi:phosphohistidine phosphatase